MMLTKLTLAATSILASAFGASLCKNHPYDASWPSIAEWNALNRSTNLALIKSSPVASSCFEGNPFNSQLACKLVQERWFNSDFQALQPESTNYPFWANNSCVPPNANGYREGQSCSLGGLPEYILNATDAEQISTAVQWASARNIRIVVKGTGHDLNGRSSGAYALSIWTHHLQSIELDSHWPHPSNKSVENAIILGSGNVWGDVLRAAATAGRTVVSGQDPTVGLGGFIGGGGHGPLSSHYGLAADQVLQATVVTTDGQILVANDAKNQDLHWAIRGGGPGAYGIVTEYVLRTYPIPQNVVSTVLSISLREGLNSTQSVDQSWTALATVCNALPDLMDHGLTGNGMAVISDTSSSVAPGVSRKAELSLTLFGYNTTAAELQSLTDPLLSRLLSAGANQSVSATFSEPTVWPTYLDFFDDLNAAGSTGGEVSLVSSRLLGRRELTDLPLVTLETQLRRITSTMIPGDSSILILGLQGGLGPKNVEQSMRGGLTPAWRKGYVHLLSTGATINTTSLTPSSALREAAAWTEEKKETVWREWAPNSGSYVNEANPFNTEFKEDYYGGNYDRLMEIKAKYDPTASLYAIASVGSHAWDYDLDSGKLCTSDEV